jgi:hypothetical protein
MHNRRRRRRRRRSNDFLVEMGLQYSRTAVSAQDHSTLSIVA